MPSRLILRIWALISVPLSEISPFGRQQQALRAAQIREVRVSRHADVCLRLLPAKRNMVVRGRTNTKHVGI
jgi:hypothetical protein